jgi:hypothetical protein
VPVHGIELSRAMAAKLAPNPGARMSASRSAISQRPPWTGRSPSFYLVFNTIMNLTTQAAQAACFRNVAVHLEPGGCFVIEVMIPELRRLPHGETYRVSSGSESHWGIESTTSRPRGSSPITSRSWTGDSRLEGEPFTSDSEMHVSVWEKPAG